MTKKIRNQPVVLYTSSALRGDFNYKTRSNMTLFPTRTDTTKAYIQYTRHLWNPDLLSHKAYEEMTLMSHKHVLTSAGYNDINHSCIVTWNQGRIKWTRGPGQNHDREAPETLSATA